MIYLYLYADCFVRAFRGVLKSPWTLALPMVYAGAIELARTLLGGFGIVGGFAMGILVDLCTSSLLYFTAQAVLGSPSRISEMKKSFLEYFWPVVSFGFVIWIAITMLGFALASNPQASRIQLAVLLVAAVLLNAVPEVVYQKSQIGGLAIIAESAKFIQEHWVEWFIPNVLLGGLIAVATFGLLLLPFGVVVVPFVVGALTYFVFAFRGNLFHLLDTTSPFQLRVRYHGGVGLGR
jgi:hypothetical protein